MKSKILITLLIIVMFLSVFIIESKAVYFPTQEDLKDGNNYHFIMKKNTGDYYLISTPEAMSYQNYGEASVFWGSHWGNVQLYKWENNIWNLQSLSSTNNGDIWWTSANGGLHIENYTTAYNMSASDYDIVYTKDQNSIFFQITPLTFQVMAVEQIPEAIQAVLRVIIPVGLGILLVLLVIYLTKSVISRMA